MRFAHWDQTLSTAESNAVLLDIASQVITKCVRDTLDRRSISNKILYCDVKGLALYKLSFDHSPYDYYILNQCIALFSKREDLDIGIDKQSAAYRTFLDFESRCSVTNEAFREHSKGNFCFSRGVSSILHAASREIAKYLGPLPSWDKLRPRFGPGSTTQVSKKDASPRSKLGCHLACSEEFTVGAATRLLTLPGWVAPTSWLKPNLGIHRAKLQFVPKNAKTYRAICVEPSLNTMFQLGIHDYLSVRCKRFGLNLDNQSLNLEAARRGSISGDLATLDLSSASDSVSLELVFSLFPIEWATELSRLRTGSVVYKGKEMKLQKWSSMGNGTTFIIECLIFLAIARAVVPENRHHDVYVYGDDIIVPVEYYPPLVDCLTAIGFVVNSDKSFHSGPFRESCGGDFFSGYDVRAFYQKGALSCRHLFELYNHLYRREESDLSTYILKFIEPSIVRWGPDGYGSSGHLISDCPPYRPHGRNLGWGGYTFETYTFTANTSVRRHPGDHVLPLYHVYISGGLSEIPARHDKMGRLVTQVPGRKSYKLMKVYTLKG